MLHKEILDPLQLESTKIFPEIDSHYFLIEGTAIALYLGHRKSIDFDFFTNKYPIKREKIRRVFSKK